MPPSDKTPLQYVMEVDTECAMLEKEAEQLAHGDANCEKLTELYEHLEEMDDDKAEMKASGILHDWVAHLLCSTEIKRMVSIPISFACTRNQSIIWIIMISMRRHG